MKISIPYLAGAFTSWIVFTKEGRDFGNKMSDKLMAKVKDLIKENKNDTSRKTSQSDRKN